MKVKCDSGPGSVLGTKWVLHQYQCFPCVNSKQSLRAKFKNCSSYLLGFLLSLSEFSLIKQFSSDKAEKQPSPELCSPFTWIFRLDRISFQDTGPHSQHCTAIASGETQILSKWVLNGRLRSLKSYPNPDWFSKRLYINRILSAVSSLQLQFSASFGHTV